MCGQSDLLTPWGSSSTIRTPDQIRLGAFEYDANSDSPIQTFPIEPEIVDLGLDMGIVIFRILSNWDGEFTCLYRVSLCITTEWGSS